jgi:hypothetical protein
MKGKATAAVSVPPSNNPTVPTSRQAAVTHASSTVIGGSARQNIGLLVYGHSKIPARAKRNDLGHFNGNLLRGEPPALGAG